MWSFFTSGLTAIVSGVVSPLFTWLNKKQDVQLEGFKAGTAYDLEAFKAASDAQVRMASIRAGVVTGRLVTWSVGLIALSTAIHWVGFEVDSTFTFWTGHYGNLGIPALPAPYDEREWELIKSLFYVGPAVPVAAAAAAWLRRK